VNISINSKMRELYREQKSLEKAFMFSNFSLMLKKQITHALNIDANKLQRQIDVHRANISNIKAAKSIAGIINIEQLIKESMMFENPFNVLKKIKIVSKNIKSTIEKSIELCKINSFIANDPYLMVANAEIEYSESLSMISDIGAIITQCIPKNDNINVGIIYHYQISVIKAFNPLACHLLSIGCSNAIS
jgi:hypothetical protein